MIVILIIGSDKISIQNLETELIIKRIKNIINERNKIEGIKLTSYRIAQNGNLHTGTLNSLINKINKDPKWSTIVKICKGLNINIRDFFDDEIFK